MMCRNFSLNYSAFLDGRSSSDEQSALAEHLRSCAACRRTAAELRCVRSELSILGRQEPPADLSADILIALQREARRKALAARRHSDLIDLWRLRIFSQSIGTVVSLALFILLTTSVFRPAYRALRIARTAAMVDDSQVVLPVPNDVLYRRLLLETPAPPIFNPSGAVLGFTESLSEEGIVIATVKVQNDGRASVKEAVGPPNDPKAVDRLSNALYRQASFPPARRKPRNPDAVLMFSKINISG
jgi:anti-sigma factor RsiW